MVRVCTKCLAAQDESEFHRRSDHGSLRSHCKSCLNEYAKARQKSHRDATYRYTLRRCYNLSEDDYNDILHKQNNCCKICKKTTGRLCVDHDHETGKIRGILCHTCNSGLGMFNDNKNLIKEALKYLESSD